MRRIASILVFFLASLLLGSTADAQKTSDAGAPPTSTIRPDGKQGVWATNSAAARPTVMLVGYWPPTNEMLRPWSTSKSQNPKGWKGSDWGKLGFDVYSYFPEYPTGSWPRGRGDFEVDYQDTSSDFWRITKALKPTVIITFSRGFFGTSWEVELNANNHSRWVNDSLNPRQPSVSPPDKSIPATTYRRSTLPAQAIVDEVIRSKVSVKPIICAYANGGTYLSEYLSFHGLWYQGLHRLPTAPDWCVAAGHIHVGTSVAVADGTKAVEATLRAVLKQANEILAGTRQPNMGLGGPGTANLQVSGQALRSGGKADLTIRGLPGNTAVGILIGGNQKQFHWERRLTLPWEPFYLIFLKSSSTGNVTLKGIPGGLGRFDLYAQAAYDDWRAPARISMTNAIQVRFLK